MNKKVKTSIILLSVLTVLSVSAAVSKIAKANSYKKTIDNGYSRSIHELTDSVKTIRYSLEKGMLVSSPEQFIRLSNEVNRCTCTAKASLGQLPLDGVMLDNTERFLAQAGDFTGALAVKTSSGAEVTKEDYDSLKNLYEYSKKLYDDFSKMQTSFLNGGLKVEKLSRVTDKNNTKYLSDTIGDAENDFVNYPSLIYDGPFSSHVDTAKYSSVKNLPEISEGEARKTVKDFLGGDDFIIRPRGEKAGKIPCYSFEVYTKSNESNHSLTFDITKNGGKIVWFLNSRSPSDSKISEKKAKENAQDFLNLHGYANMQPCYYEVVSNVMTVNFAYSQSGVIMYPDLIKVKIAMDTGECIGIEATGYLMNNKLRPLGTEFIGEEEARKKVSSSLKINQVKLCVIPTEYLSEIVCYEVKGSVGEDNFLVYINAVSGKQEKILILLTKENGVLTV